jgi:hypothetical protein
MFNGNWLRHKLSIALHISNNFGHKLASSF